MENKKIKKLSKDIILNNTCTIKQPKGSSLGFYIDNELRTPLSTLEEFLAFKINDLLIEIEKLKKQIKDK